MDVIEHTTDMLCSTAVRNRGTMIRQAGKRGDGALQVAGQLFELADETQHRRTATRSQSRNTAISFTLLMSANMAASAGKKSIVFVHPDLGIGGAERLIIDAAMGLQSSGHKVTILTSYRDTNHCFDEARDGRWALD
jgi:hypothetical protein